MTSTELAEWITYHKATFGSWKRFLDEQSDQEAAFTMERIAGMIGGLTLESAKAATDQILMMETTPRAERHVVEVWRIARDIDARASGRREYAKHGEVTYRCSYCRDTGKCGVFIGSAPFWMMKDPETGHRVRVVEWVWKSHNFPDNAIRQIHSVRCCCQDGGLGKEVLDAVVTEWGPRWHISNSEPPRVVGMMERAYWDLSPDEKRRVDQCHDELQKRFGGSLRAHTEQKQVVCDEKGTESKEMRERFRQAVELRLGEYQRGEKERGEG